MENLSVWRNSGTVTAPNVYLWFTIHIFSKQPFYGNYSTLDSHTYKHCNFSRCYLYSSRSVCEPAIQKGSHCVTAKGSRGKPSHTHKEISKKHFSCVYSFIKLYFFPDCRLSGPKTGIRGYHSSTFLAFIAHLCLSCRKLILN